MCGQIAGKAGDQPAACGVCGAAAAAWAPHRRSAQSHWCEWMKSCFQLNKYSSWYAITGVVKGCWIISCWYGVRCDWSCFVLVCADGFYCVDLHRAGGEVQPSSGGCRRVGRWRLHQRTGHWWVRDIVMFISSIHPSIHLSVIPSFHPFFLPSFCFSFHLFFLFLYFNIFLPSIPTFFFLPFPIHATFHPSFLLSFLPSFHPCSLSSFLPSIHPFIISCQPAFLPLFLFIFIQLHSSFFHPFFLPSVLSSFHLSFLPLFPSFLPSSNSFFIPSFCPFFHPFSLPLWLLLLSYVHSDFLFSFFFFHPSIHASIFSFYLLFFFPSIYSSFLSSFHPAILPFFYFFSSILLFLHPSLIPYLLPSIHPSIILSFCFSFHLFSILSLFQHLPSIIPTFSFLPFPIHATFHPSFFLPFLPSIFPFFFSSIIHLFVISYLPVTFL